MKKILMCLILPSIVFAQSETSGAGFLKIGMGPRAGSMGEAYVAVAADASGAYYNPAAIARAGSSQISLTHRAWIADIQSQSLNASIPWGNASVGLTVTTTSTPDIEIRTRPGDPEGTFTSRDFVLGGIVAYRLTDDISVGGTLKYIFEKIFVDDWSGLGIDLGMQYKLPIQGAALGASVSNLGSMSGTGVPAIKLPITMRLGAAYTLPVEALQSDITLAADAADLPRDGIVHVNFGGEILFDNTVALRLGYQTGYDFRSFSAGVGVRYRAFALNYCIIPMSQQAGTAQTIGLDIIL